MVRSCEEIEDILEEIQIMVIEANRRGELDEFLAKIGLVDGTEKSASFESFKSGKIVVLGQSEVKEKVLLAVATDLGLDKDRFEFCLDYNLLCKYNYKKLCYASQYRIVLAGPMGHKTSGTGDSSSAITNMENSDGYPRVVRLCGNNALKITKNSFREALKKLISEEYI